MQTARAAQGKRFRIYCRQNFTQQEYRYGYVRNRTTPVSNPRDAAWLRRTRKEVAIECQRLGIEVIAVDRYADAPAMQVAHRSHVINMLDGAALKKLVAQEMPDFIVPEIEAIATDALVELEQQGQRVVPTARAARLTMNREGIRRLAAEELGLPTSAYRFAENEAEFREAVAEIGLPCIVKPVMSSSGKGQSFIRSEEMLESARQYAQQGGRAGAGKVIVEGVVKFDFEITLLTISAVDGVHFCAPIGHRREDGDYRELAAAADE